MNGPRNAPPPDLNYYRDDKGKTWLAAVIERRPKTINLLLIGRAQLSTKRVPIAEAAYLRPIDAGNTSRKASAQNLRRLAKKAGTPRTVREAVKIVLTPTENPKP